MKNQPKSTASIIEAIISQALFTAFLVFICFFVTRNIARMAFNLAFQLGERIPSAVAIATTISNIIGIIFILLTIALNATWTYRIFSTIQKRKTYIICHYIYAFVLALFGCYMLYLGSIATGTLLAGLGEVLVGLFSLAIAIITALSLTVAIITFYFKNKASKRMSDDNSIT